jgi:maleate isomerase
MERGMNRYGYGWRGKFGFINPAIADSLMLEFYKLLPEGVLATVVDQKVQNLADEDFAKVIENMEQAARVLDYEEVHAITIGGTPPLLRKGFDTPDRVVEEFQRKFGKPFSSTPTSEVNAMRSLGMRRLLLVTPFRPELSETIRAYLQYKNFEVVHVKGANIQKNSDLVKHTGQQLYSLVRDAVREAKTPFDGIHINCPRWPVVDMVEMLENDLSVPIVSSCQAIIWEALNMLGVREVRPGSGHLFDGFPKSG